MRLLLDTHVLIWLANGDTRLSASRRIAIEDERNELFLSSVSVFEISAKHRVGKLDMKQTPRIWMELLEQKGIMRHLDITRVHAMVAGELPLIHRDPFDRLLIAQAMEEGLVLMTSDSWIRQYPVPLFD